MRSYHDHLKSLAPGAFTYGVFRASAIFPAFERKEVSTRILFMGYWMLKRGIKEIGQVATLRAKDGTFINRQYRAINEPRAFRVEAKDLLPEDLKDKDFEGSLEVEFYSSSNMVFPYPAAVINYYGPAFSTCVHTAQRTYNNFEDRSKNSETHVKESGFNLYEQGDLQSFVSLVNGPETLLSRTLTVEAINWKNEHLEQSLPLGDLKPYQTVVVHPGKELHLKEFFDGKPGACKLGFDFDWIFPRLVAGNELKNPESMMITHTYYDCSEACSPKDYWQEESADHYAASLMIPVDTTSDAFTNVYFYPIYSPSHFAIDLEIFSREGKSILKKKDVLIVGKNQEPFQKIALKDLDLPEGKWGCLLTARRLDDQLLPSRIKVALDMGYKNPLTPCNICTNLAPYSAKMASKPTSFKWAPVLADQPRSSLWLLNSTQERDYKTPATIDLTFHREDDNEVIHRPVILPPQGFISIEIENDPELVEFFGGKVGWATMVSSNPLLTTFYFAINPSGVVGGDHGF